MKTMLDLNYPPIGSWFVELELEEEVILQAEPLVIAKRGETLSLCQFLLTAVVCHPRLGTFRC